MSLLTDAGLPGQAHFDERNEDNLFGWWARAMPTSGQSWLKPTPLLPTMA